MSPIFSACGKDFSHSNNLMTAQNSLYIVHTHDIIINKRQHRELGGIGQEEDKRWDSAVTANMDHSSLNISLDIDLTFV